VVGSFDTAGILPKGIPMAFPPIDLLNDILEILSDDHHTLLQCALVSKSWVDRARHIFFSNPENALVIGSQRALALELLETSPLQRVDSVDTCRHSRYKEFVYRDQDIRSEEKSLMPPTHT
jgi:hypothetical protein